MTAGGYGPTTNSVYPGDEKSKDMTLTQKVFQTCHSILCCTFCCSSGNNSGTGTTTTTTTMMGTTASLLDNATILDDESLYYEDSFNDLSWSCTFGTSDEDGIWINQADPAGTIMAFLVWVLLLYSALTMTLLAMTGGIPPIAAMVYNVVAALALASHVKTSLTDPGAVPTAAVPTQAQRASAQKLSMCSQCQTFKPPFSHHCRICNRCISRMDHHCPWYVLCFLFVFVNVFVF